MIASSSGVSTVALASFRQVGNRHSLAPLGHCMLIDAITRRKGPQVLFIILYWLTDCLSRGGAPVKNLAHSGSFNSEEKIASAKSGIKHLGSGVL